MEDDVLNEDDRLRRYQPRHRIGFLASMERERFFARMRERQDNIMFHLRELRRQFSSRRGEDGEEFDDDADEGAGPLRLSRLLADRARFGNDFSHLFLHIGDKRIDEWSCSVEMLLLHIDEYSSILTWLIKYDKLPIAQNIAK